MPEGPQLQITRTILVGRSLRSLLALSKLRKGRLFVILSLLFSLLSSSPTAPTPHTIQTSVHQRTLGDLTLSPTGDYEFLATH